MTIRQQAAQATISALGWAFDRQVAAAQSMAEARVCNACARAEDWAAFGTKMKAAKDAAMWAVVQENKTRLAKRMFSAPTGYFRNTHGLVMGNVQFDYSH